MAELQDTASGSFEEEQEYDSPFSGGGAEAPATIPAFSNTEAALRNSLVSDNPVEGYRQGMEQGHELTNHKILEQGRLAGEGAFAEALEREVIAKQQPLDPEVITQVQQEVQSNFQKETSPERAVLEQVEGYWDLDEDLRESMVVNRWVSRQLAELSDKSGYLEKAVDFLGAALVPDETQINVDFANKVLGTEAQLSDALNSADNLIRLGKAFQLLEPEERLSLFKLAQKEVKTVEDNELQQLFLLMGLAGRTTPEEELFSQTLDKFAVVGTVGKLLSGMMKMSRLPKDLAKLNRIDDLGVLSDQVVRGNLSPRDAQMGRIEAGSVGMPTTTGDLAKIIDSSDEAIATDIKLKWAEIELLEAEARNLPRENISQLLSPEDIEVVRKRALASVADQPGLENVVMRETSDGIEMSFDIRDRGLSPGLKETTSSVDKDAVKAAFMEDLKARLLADSSSRISRGDKKNLEAELKDLKFKFDSVTTDVKGKAKALATKEASDERLSLQQKINTVQSKLDSSKPGEVAEANLTRVEQGIIPSEFKEEFDSLTRGRTSIEAVEGSPDVVRTLSKTVRFTTDDISSSFKTDKVTVMDDLFSFFISPKRLFRKDRDTLVYPFERIANASPKMKRNLTAKLNMAIKGLSKDSVDNVQRVIEKGNAGKGKVYTYQEIVNEGIGGIHLTRDEYVGYAATRKVFDDLWVLKDQDVRSQYLSKDAKLVNVSGDQKGFASVSEDAVDAVRKYSKDENFKKVYDPLAGTLTSKVSNERIGVLYNQGFVLTKLVDKGAFWNLGKGKPKWAFVKKESVSDLPTHVLKYKPGYAPRIYDDAYWFVRQAGDGVIETVGGVVKKHPMPKTLRYFSNKTDANTYIEKLAAEGTPREQLSATFNRDPFNNPDLEEDVLSVFGGLFASPRKTEALKFGLDGADAKLVDPLEAMQQYMFHLSNRIPVSEYRLGIQKMWMNTLERHKGNPVLSDFNSALKEVDDLAVDPRTKKLLTKSHEQIRTLSSIPTKDEQALMGRFRSIGEAMEEAQPGLKGASKWLYSLSEKSPVNSSKAAVHHLFLGMGNIIQYPIQASGFTVAASINPVHAGKGLSKNFAFTYLDNIRDPLAKAEAIKKISKSSIPGLADIAETYKLWNRTGYRDSVLSSSGDYATLSNGLPYDAALIRRLLDKGEMFFKSGELVNMRVSFTTSLERWKDLNPGRALDDIALKEIFARSEDFRLSMGQGNRARFQKGIASVPLMFQQVSTKFLEAILPGSPFTLGERARLLASQGALYGLAGVPAASGAYSVIVDMFDVDMSDVTAEEMNVRSNGITGWYINNSLGIDANVTDRISFSANLFDTAYDMIFEDNNLFGLLGAPGSVASGILDGPVADLLNVGRLVVSAEGLSKANLGTMMESLVWSLADLPSSSRKAVMAAVLFDSGMVRDSSGKILWMDDPELETFLFQAAGLNSADKKEYYELLSNDRKRQDVENDLVKSSTKLFTRLTRMVDDEEDGIEQARDVTSIVLKLTGDPELTAKIMKRVGNNMKSDDRLARLIEKSTLNMSDYSTPADQVTNIHLRRAVTGE